MSLKKALTTTLCAITLLLSGCSSEDKENTYTIKKGDIHEFFTLFKGQKLILSGEVISLEVQGGDVVVTKTGKVGVIYIDADAVSGNDTSQPELPSTVTVEARYGAVGGINNLGGAKIYWTANNQIDANLILRKPGIANSGLIFGANLTIAPLSEEDRDALFEIGLLDDNGYEPSEYDGYLVDGKGFTLTGHSNRNILVVRANGVVIRNITITQTAENKKENPSNGITFYRAKDGVLEGVTLKNCGRAGVIMAASTATATNLRVYGSIWGSVNLSLGANTVGEQAPGFELISGKLDDNFKIYVDLDSFPEGTPEPRYSVIAPKGWVDKLVSKRVLDDDGALIRIQNMDTYFPRGQDPLLKEEEKV